MTRLLSVSGELRFPVDDRSRGIGGGRQRCAMPEEVSSGVPAGLWLGRGHLRQQVSARQGSRIFTPSKSQTILTYSIIIIGQVRLVRLVRLLTFLRQQTDKRRQTSVCKMSKR
jgi:hypothetical protein